MSEKKDSCACVYATSRNTESVRKGYEQGGYLKHECAPCTCWRQHSAQFAKGVTPPQTLDALQAAWDRDQELIAEQRQEIARMSQTINQLRQKRPSIPDVLFDGPAVHGALSEKAATRTFAENVSDVLDAVARLLRQATDKEQP